MTTIAFCGCPPLSQGAKYQEDSYGSGNRVFNEKATREGIREWRCTCCAKVKRGLANSQADSK